VDAASYAIDIAARMSGGPQTFAELDQLTAQLSGAGKGAAHFQEAIQRVSTSLDAARVASAQANEALAAGQDEYKLLERAALQAAKASEKMNLKKGVVDPETNAALEAANAALDTHAAKLKGLESFASVAAKGEQDLVRTLNNVRTMSGHVDRSLAQQTERLSRVQGALGQLGGPVGTLGRGLLIPVKGFQDMSQSMGAAGAASLLAAAGIGIIVAAVVAVTVATVAGVIAITNWAIKMGDATRKAELAREALEAIRPDLIGLRGEFIELARDTGQSESALVALHASLRDAKVGAAAMPAALRAAALAEAALGQGGAAKFVEQIKAGTLAVSDFALNAEQSFGGIVARQLLGLEAQGVRFKANIGGLFGGLDIEPALLGLREIVGLFDANTVAGQTIKFLFETLFQPLINGARTAADAVVAFGLGLLIGLTKIYIALKPTIKSLKEAFGIKDDDTSDTMASITRAAEYLAPVLVMVIAGFAAMAAAVLLAVGVIGVSIGIMAAGFAVVIAAIVAPIYGLIYLIQNWSTIWASVWSSIAGVAQSIGAAIAGAIASVVNYFATIDWLGLGAAMMRGLANGIIGAAGAVVSAISGAVQGAISKAKSMLGIASPSKVFAGLGAYTAEGMARGLDSGASEVQAAMAEVVAPPVSALSAQDALGGNIRSAVAASASAQAPAAEPAKGAGISVTGPFIFNGVKDGPDSADKFGEWLDSALDGTALALGVGEAG